jgi:hypothetical protein
MLRLAMAKREPSEEGPEQGEAPEPGDAGAPGAAASGAFGGRAGAPGPETSADGAPGPLPGAGTRDGEKLREAFRAFEVGDYRRVRARCADLARAEDPAVRDAAAELKARTDPDPVQVVVIAACAALLATIVYVWVL